MDDKPVIRIVKQKLNNINYDYNLIYNKLDKIMSDDKMIDLGESRINIFGLFSINFDTVPDIVERKTTISIIVGILEDLQFLEISNKKLRLKLEINEIKDNTLNKVKQSKTNNSEVIKFIKKFYSKKIETNFKSINLDDNLFVYVMLLLISIIEDSSIVFLGHQLNLEVIPLENGLEESLSDNIIINKILDKL